MGIVGLRAAVPRITSEDGTIVMSTGTEQTGSFAGIDVSKDWLDVHLAPSGRAWRVENSPTGHDALARELAREGCRLALLEASGGYEYAAAAAIEAAEVPVRVLNALQARRFVQSLDAKGAKTDALDARALALLASVAKTIGLDARPAADAERRALAELVSRRSQLVDMITAEKVRSHQAKSGAVRADIDLTMKALKERLRAIEREIARAVDRSEQLRQQADVLRSVPGVGDATAFMLLAHMPELGRISAKQAASLAGLAPVANDSGKRRGRRSIRGGRGRVRRSLRMAAMTAVRCDAQGMRIFYRRLRDSGKSFSVAITACMRKLIVMLNTLMHERRPWSKTPPALETSNPH